MINFTLKRHSVSFSPNFQNFPSYNFVFPKLPKVSFSLEHTRPSLMSPPSTSPNVVGCIGLLVPSTYWFRQPLRWVRFVPSICWFRWQWLFRRSLETCRVFELLSSPSSPSNVQLLCSINRSKSVKVLISLYFYFSVSGGASVCFSFYKISGFDFEKWFWHPY